ncbi:hypothetical protein PR002_g23296 [Phytophthora rubi]|uniref:Uncharacterized protein n=1 Tax=Phytophthora rubi TaxID=129364 RepID=A0A6A3IK15_9STRA|nr:hypothetical protein PR002_g23296 [Phytophthora rubi]
MSSCERAVADSAFFRKHPADAVSPPLASSALSTLGRCRTRADLLVYCCFERRWCSLVTAELVLTYGWYAASIPLAARHETRSRLSKI